jgi:DNA polymerase-3 subunit alpha
MVTDVQHMMTRNNRPWGRFKLSDYNGTHEFSLFGKDYENFRNFVNKDYFLFVRGKVQPRMRWDKETGRSVATEEMEFKILSMTQLAEMMDNIKSIQVRLPLPMIDKELSEELPKVLKKCKGKATLYVTVFEPETGVKVGFLSKGFKVEVSQELLAWLDERDLDYSIA